VRLYKDPITGALTAKGAGIDAAEAVGTGFSATETARLQAIAARPGITKTLYDLRFLQSTNTAADATQAYIAHIDITPEEFAFFAEGWTVEVQMFVESGLQGAAPINRVTAGSVVRNLGVRIGTPASGASGTIDGLSAVATPTMSAAQLTLGTMVVGVSRAAVVGASVEFLNMGNSPFNASSNAIAALTNTFAANGLRVAISGNFTSAVAGHIIKVLGFQVTLRP